MSTFLSCHRHRSHILPLSNPAIKHTGDRGLTWPGKTLTFVFNKEGMIDVAVSQHLHPADLGHVVRRHPQAEHLASARGAVTSLGARADHINLENERDI